MWVISSGSLYPKWVRVAALSSLLCPLGPQLAASAFHLSTSARARPASADCVFLSVFTALPALLDESSEKVIATLFEATKSAGAALVLVTHDADLAERCERVLTIEDGRIVGDRKTKAGAA